MQLQGGKTKKELALEVVDAARAKEVSSGFAASRIEGISERRTLKRLQVASIQQFGL